MRTSFTCQEVHNKADKQVENMKLVNEQPLAIILPEDTQYQNAKIF